MQFLYIGMVFTLRQHPGDDPALIGDPQTPFGAERLDIDGLVHEISVWNEATRRS